MSEPIYFQLYALLQMYIYGVDTVLTPDMTLTLTMISTIGSILVIVFPIALIMGACKRWL